MNQLAYRRVLPIVVAFLITRLLVLALYAPEIVWGDQLQYVRIANSNLDHGWLDYLDPGFVLEAGSYYPYFKNSPSLPDGMRRTPWRGEVRSTSVFEEKFRLGKYRHTRPRNSGIPEERIRQSRSGE